MFTGATGLIEALRLHLTLSVLALLRRPKANQTARAKCQKKTGRCLCGTRRLVWPLRVNFNEVDRRPPETPEEEEADEETSGPREAQLHVDQEHAAPSRVQR